MGQREGSVQSNTIYWAGRGEDESILQKPIQMVFVSFDDIPYQYYTYYELCQ